MTRKSVIISIFLIALIGGSFWLWSHYSYVNGETWTDHENDEADVHAGGPHDIFACNGVQEDMQAPTGSYNNSFPPVQVDADIDWDDQDIDINEDWMSDTQFNQMISEGSLSMQSPQLDIALSPVAPEEGQEIEATAAVQMLRSTDMESMDTYFAWSLDGVSMMGVVAGGDPLDLLPSSLRDSCTTVTRIPDTDVDGDGMDDAWEERYFVRRNLADSIADVLPEDDGDLDGFAPIDLVNLQGQPLILTPLLSTAATVPTGTLDIQDSAYTNLEEYIWGTDPTDPDTDDDGYLDGEDIAGRGQLSLKFTPTKGVHDFPPHQLRATVGGISFQTLTDDTHDSEELVKLDSDVKDVFISTGEKLEGILNMQPDIAAPGETVTFTFQPLQTDADPGALAYEWRFDGEPKTNPLPSAEIFEYLIRPTEHEPRSAIDVDLEVVNPSTGQLTTIQSSYFVAEPIDLVPMDADIVPGSSTTVNTYLISGADPSDFLFKWYVDNSLDERASGVGNNSLTFDVEEDFGGYHRVKLELFDISNSRLVGRQQIDLPIAGPSIELTFIPEIAQPGETVTVVAEAVNFPRNLDTDQDDINDASQIEFVFELDGAEVGSDINAAGAGTMSFTAGNDNEIYKINISAKTTGEEFQSAEAIGQYQVGAGPISYETSLFNRFTASLIQNPRTYIISVISIGIITLIFFLVLRSMMPRKANRNQT
ncbi:hypothetical protein ACFL1U_00545 [Patescibacteria group bacterium]